MNSAYKIRSGLIFLLLSSLYAVILITLYTVQIRNRHFFTTLGTQQYQVSVTNMPERALIYDRHGNPLALNTAMLSAFMLPKKIEQKKKLESFLRTHFPAALERLHQHPEAHFLYVKRKLSPAQRTVIEQRNLPDIQLLSEPHRFYPAACMGPIVGITDVDNVGLFGVEKLYNQQLAGKPTTYTIERDARSGHCYFTKTTKVHGNEGSPLQLTIDAPLQYLAFERLKDTVTQWHAKEGAVLVMNPENGEILVMAQLPTIDPNNTESIAIMHANNRLVTDAHELGSVMKVFTALAALDEKVVAIDEPIDCENVKIGYLNGFKISTWHAHGVLPFSQVIELSNNIGIAKIAQRLGKKLYDHYGKLGFGKKTALHWPGEQKGFVNPPTQWSKQSIISLSFGYEITATLLQLAQAFCMIANRGAMVKPRITPAKPEEVAQEKRQLYAQETVDVLRGILEKTVSQGTAKKAAIKGYTIMGKTGTANMVVNGAYSPTRNTYTFACIVEKGEYKRVIVTFVKEIAQTDKIYASSVAVPLCEAVMEDMLIYEKIF